MYGTPLLYVLQDLARPLRFTVAGNTDVAMASMLEVFDLMRDGRITVVEAADRLRTSGGVLARLGDWIEKHPGTSQTVATLIAGVVAAIGPQVVFRNDEGGDDTTIIKIIDELDRDPPERAPQQLQQERDYPSRHFSRDSRLENLEDIAGFRWSKMGPLSHG